MSTRTRPARRTLPILIALFVLASTSGCLTFLSTIKLNPDGSGHVIEEVRLNPTLAGMMKSMAQQADTTGGATKLFSEAEVRKSAAQMGAGVRLVSMERLPSGNGYRAVYAFEDINTLRLNQNPDARLPEDASEKRSSTNEAPQEPVTFSFTPGPPATLTVHLPQEENDDPLTPAANSEGAQADSMNAQELALMRGMFANARMAMRLEVQGSITETNATHREGSRITFYDVNFGKMLQSEGAFKTFMQHSNQNASMAEMKDMAADMPGFKVELQEMVRVRFQ